MENNRIIIVVENSRIHFCKEVNPFILQLTLIILTTTQSVCFLSSLSLFSSDPKSSTQNKTQQQPRDPLPLPAINSSLSL